MLKIKNLILHDFLFYKKCLPHKYIKYELLFIQLLSFWLYCITDKVVTFIELLNEIID